jgi:hypothetical protein
MDKLIDFFKDVKVRISSPLISSFIIAWSVINWRVPISLIFYRQPELKIDGYDSYFELISGIPLAKYFLWPFFIALFYTFIFPFVRNCIHAFNSWVNKWGLKWEYSISKEASISMDNFYKLKKELDTKSGLVNEALEHSNKMEKENGKLNDVNKHLMMEK